jgi:hypothetical protein
MSRLKYLLIKYFLLGSGGNCPSNAIGDLCFQDGVKGCYPKGKQPSQWFTNDVRCVANKDCFCYSAPTTTVPVPSLVPVPVPTPVPAPVPSTVPVPVPTTTITTTMPTMTTMTMLTASLSTTPAPCCGLKKKGSRIVGGSVTDVSINSKIRTSLLMIFDTLG